MTEPVNSDLDGRKEDVLDCSGEVPRRDDRTRAMPRPTEITDIDDAMANKNGRSSLPQEDLVHLTRTPSRFAISDSNGALEESQESSEEVRRLKELSSTSRRSNIMTIEIAEAMRTPVDLRTSRHNKLIRRYKTELFALQYPFLYGISDHRFELRTWGIALDNEGVKQNPGLRVSLPESSMIGKDVWVVPLDSNNHTINNVEGKIRVESLWQIDRKKDSGTPRWLYFNVIKSKSLSFSAPEVRLPMGDFREVVLVDLKGAKSQMEQTKVPCLPITASINKGNGNGREHTTIGEYSIEMSSFDLSETHTRWAIKLLTEHVAHLD